MISARTETAARVFRASLVPGRKCFWLSKARTIQFFAERWNELENELASFDVVGKVEKKHDDNWSEGMDENPF